ncbi:LPXTG cell wall anchor domain-containing protein [Streptococcus suis]|uniref:LPXTG cell wall anchor domain-containing protein n=1 Tax=Streptococcus suis TaxID=1307 RepID=UPI002FCA610E
MKRSSRKKRLAKLSKLGLSLAAVTVLGGLVEPMGLADFVSPKVYATEQADPALEVRKAEIKTMIQSYRDLVGQIKALNPADYTEESWNRKYEGDVRIYLGAQSIATAYNDDLTFSSLSLDGVDSHQTLNELNATYMFGYHFVENSIPILKQAMADLVPISKSVETPKQQKLPYTVEWYVDGQYYDGYTGYINPGELYDRWVADRGSSPVWSAFADLPENSPQYYEITYEKVAAGENYYRFDLVSKDKATVPYTIELVDQDGQVLQTIQQSGVEGTEVGFDFPVISGYRVGKTEGFDSWTYGKSGTFRLVANKTVKVYYDKAPSIDSLIKPEQRVEYQKVFDTFHTTVLKAFEVYKKELGVDHIIRLTEDEAKFNQITQSEDLTTLQLELILVENLFNEPVGLVLTDQDIINAIGWTPEYWDYQIAYHKEIIQKLEKALANIAASKVIPPVETPTEQPVEQPAETPVEQPVEQPTEQPVEPPVETPTEQPVEKPVERPTTKPTDQSAPGKQVTKQGDKEQAPSASSSQKEEVKPAPASQSQAKTLPATGEVSSVLHLTGLGLLGLAGLAVKRRQRKLF